MSHRRIVPLKGHDYHRKSSNELRFIVRDAGEAARNFRNSGLTVPGSTIPCENKYLDQCSDAQAILNYRTRYGISVPADHRSI